MAGKALACLAVIVLVCTGATARPIRMLQQTGGTVGYVPVGKGCELKVTVTAEKSDSSGWWGSGPSISGNVKILNPQEYGIPVANVQVKAQSSTGQVYTGYAKCENGGSSTYVPVNPTPYTYGESDCTYKIQLDNRVFSPSPSSTGSSNGLVGYFPNNNNNNNNNNNGYYPPNSRPTWTVTAVVTTGMTNALCYSQPATVDTSSWWSWFMNIIGGSSSRGSSVGSTAPNAVGSAAPKVSGH